MEEERVFEVKWREGTVLKIYRVAYSREVIRILNLEDLGYQREVRAFEVYSDGRFRFAYGIEYRTGERKILRSISGVVPYEAFKKACEYVDGAFVIYKSLKEKGVEYIDDVAIDYLENAIMTVFKAYWETKK